MKNARKSRTNLKKPSIIFQAFDSTEKIGYGERSKNAWRSGYQFVTCTVAALLSINLFERKIIRAGNDSDPTILHYFITFFVISMPIIYMEIVCGQYTRLGPSQLFYLSPMSRGIGHTFVMTYIIKLLKVSLAMVDIFLYSITTFHPQWLICPNDYKINTCWSPENPDLCKEYCLKQEVELSTVIYWRDVYMDHVNTKHPTYGEYNLPSEAKCVTLFFFWLFMFLLMIIMTDYKAYLIRSFNVCETIFILLCTVMLFAGGNKYIFHVVGDLNAKSLVNFQAWHTAMVYTTEMVGTGRAVHMLHGSYLKSNNPAGIWATLTTLVVFVNFFMSIIVCDGSVGKIIAMTNLDFSKAVHILFKDKICPPVLIVVPQALGFTNGGKLLTILYFFLCSIMLINNVIVNMYILEKCLSDIYPALNFYKKYVIGIASAILTVVGIFFGGGKVYHLFRHFQKRICNSVEMFSSTVMTINVCYVYGVQKLKDDVQFMTGQPMTKYWTICLYLTPLPSMSIFIYEFFMKSLPNDTTFRICHWVFIAVLFVPLLGFFFVELFYHVRAHDLLGFIRHHERWGPADPEERALRRIYNPRCEVKWRRRCDVCLHKCLVDNKIMQQHCEKETHKRIKFITQQKSISEIVESDSCTSSESTISDQ